MLHFLYSCLFELVLFFLWSYILVLGDCWHNAGVVLPFFNVVFWSSLANNHVLHRDLVLSDWGSCSVGSLLCWLLFQGIYVILFHFLFLWSPEAMLPVWPVCYGLLGYPIFLPIVSCWVELQGSPDGCPHLSVGWADVSDLFGIACSADILYSCLCISGSYELWPSLFALHLPGCDLSLSFEFCIFSFSSFLIFWVCSLLADISFSLLKNWESCWLSTKILIFPSLFINE